MRSAMRSAMRSGVMVGDDGSCLFPTLAKLQTHDEPRQPPPLSVSRGNFGTYQNNSSSLSLEIPSHCWGGRGGRPPDPSAFAKRGRGRGDGTPDR
jgi:hypothetical protein